MKQHVALELLSKLPPNEIVKACRIAGNGKAQKAYIVGYEDTPTPLERALSDYVARYLDNYFADERTVQLQYDARRNAQVCVSANSVEITIGEKNKIKRCFIRYAKSSPGVDMIRHIMRESGDYDSFAELGVYPARFYRQEDFV